MIWLTERTVEDLVLEVRERKLVHQSIRRAIVLGIFGTLVFVIGTLLIARAFHHDARVGTVAVPLYASVFTGLVYRTTSRRIREYKERFGRTWRDGLAAKAELNARYGRFGSAGTENRP